MDRDPRSLNRRLAVIPELRQRWTDALRSGRYQRTQSSLRTCDGYCCLGVLADIIDPKGWTLTDDHSTFVHNRAKKNDEYDGDDYLADHTLTEVGMSDSVQNTLAVQNDDGKSFQQIATWIETHDLITGEEVVKP
jgi:hypothetical protein